MFRSYQDTVRTPKEADKLQSTEVYNCNMCDKGGWLTETDVEIHKKNAHSLIINQYKVKFKDRFCTICMTLQESNEELISHIKSQHLLSSPTAQRVERMIYICDECTHIFFNKDALATHVLYVHLTKKYSRKNEHFSCPKCFKKCPFKSIWFHFQKHEIPSVSLCDICLTNFPNRAKLHEHMETHKGYYKCEPCGYNGSKYFNFEAHIRMHALREIPFRNLPITVIHSVFKKHKNNFTKYNMHNAIKGLNLPRFIDICTLCREICLSHAEMKTHILRDHMYDGSEKKKHVCVCGEEFNYKVVLTQHVMKMKGSHKPLDETSALGRETKASIDNVKRKKFKSLLQFNDRDSEVQDSTSVEIAENKGNADRITVEISEADNQHSEDQSDNDLKMKLSNNIELISSENTSSMEYTEGQDADNITAAVGVPTELQLNKATL